MLKGNGNVVGSRLKVQGSRLGFSIGVGGSATVHYPNSPVALVNPVIEDSPTAQCLLTTVNFQLLPSPVLSFYHRQIENGDW